MKKSDPTNDNLTSRVIPGLKSEYRIVSLPFWAWFWLDDFMLQHRISYQGMLDSFGGKGDVNNTLKKIAELHQDHCMRGAHNLANDNAFLEAFETKDITSTAWSKPYVFPQVYKLFDFIPCVTTLEAIWSRKNYNEHNQIS
jgi:hypothetical protein